jgi:hypothetical protein
MIDRHACCVSKWHGNQASLVICVSTGLWLYDNKRPIAVPGIHFVSFSVRELKKARW